MYTINIKGKPNPKGLSMVKMEIIFVKTNDPQITKVVNITSHMTDWGAKY